MREIIIAVYVIMSFTLILQSNNGTLDTAGQTQSVTYNFDWRSIPDNNHDGEYELTFSFVSQGTATTANTIFLPTVNWGAIHDVYQVTTANGTPLTLALGYVKAGVIGTGVTGQFSADMSQNVPIRITSKPTQNQFQVQLISIASGLFALGNVPYILSIHFRAIPHL